MVILNEVYRHGLDEAGEYGLRTLDAYEDSFIAFQILLDMEEEAVLNLGKSFEYTVEGLPNYFLEGEEGVSFSFVEAVYTEAGPMADILSEKRRKRVAAGQRINVFAYLERPPASCSQIKVWLYRRQAGMERSLVEEECIPVDYRGRLGLGKEKRLELWQHPTTLARHYGLEPYSEECFEVLESYIEALARLGTRTVTTILSDAPWNGQVPLLGRENLSNLYENNMATIQTSPFCVDFSALDRYIELCFRHGIDEEIDIFGLAGVWTHERPLLSSSERSLTEEEAGQYRDAVYRHFVERGYADKAFICIDEPRDGEKLKEEITYIRRHYPRFRIKCAFDKEEMAEELGPLADKVSVSFFLAARGYQADSWYICCGPETPNSFVSSKLIEIRSLAYLSRKFGIKNILRWSCMAFTDHPHTDARFGNFRAGDSYFIYPGRLGRPELSLRYIQFLRLREELELVERDEELYREAFRIWDMKNVLLKDYQVREEFLNRDYEFYRRVRRSLSL